MTRAGRPVGEVRLALAAAVGELGGGTWRELAAHACVGYEVAKRTVFDMARAGEVAAAGTVQVAGSARPMVRFIAPQRAAAPAALEAVLRGWADFE